jgi:NADPH:quinone reductase-like Zn-dependent oxidoreductase
MRAVVIREHGDPTTLCVEELADPSPAADQVLVEVRAVALNHLDLWVRRGVPGHPFPLPLIPGSDVAGVIRSTGDAAGTMSPGTEVVIAPGVSCGTCAACVGGRDHRCRAYGILGETRDGGCAELVAVPRENIVAKPPSLSFEQAAAVGIPFLTAWHMLVDRAALSHGETVLVHAGGSGVGSAAIQIARMWNATVVATAGNDGKAARARELGANHSINYSRESVAKRVREITNGRGADIVVEHVGEATWDDSLRSLAPHGRLVTCGATTGAGARLNLRHLFFKSISVLGSTMGSKAEYREVLGHAARGLLIPVVAERLELDQIATAHEMLEARRVFGRVVLTP